MGTERDPSAAGNEEVVDPARAQRRLMLGIGIGIGIALVVAFSCVGGIVAMMVWGLGMVTSEVEAQLRGNAALREHIGAMQEFEMDWSKSFSEPDEDVYVYRVEGSQGAGLVRAESLTADEGEQVIWAELQLPSGEVVELVEREN